MIYFFVKNIITYFWRKKTKKTWKIENIKFAKDSKNRCFRGKFYYFLPLFYYFFGGRFCEFGQTLFRCMLTTHPEIHLVGKIWWVECTRLPGLDPVSCNTFEVLQNILRTEQTIYRPQAQTIWCFGKQLRVLSQAPWTVLPTSVNSLNRDSAMSRLWERRVSYSPRWLCISPPAIISSACWSVAYWTTSHKCAKVGNHTETNASRWSRFRGHVSATPQNSLDRYTKIARLWNDSPSSSCVIPLPFKIARNWQQKPPELTKS